MVPLCGPTTVQVAASDTALKKNMATVVIVSASGYSQEIGLTRQSAWFGGNATMRQPAQRIGPCLLVAVMIGLASVTLRATDSGRPDNRTQQIPSESLGSEGETQPEPNASLEMLPALIRQLGDRDYGKRVIAFRAIERIGAQGLPVLRRALDSESDPEVRRLLQNLVSGLDRRSVLSPTLVTLRCKNKPASDVLLELQKQSNVKFNILSGGQPGQRNISLDLEKVPFWLALTRVCELAGYCLQDENYYFSNDTLQVPLVLLRNDRSTGYHFCNGPFRVSVRGIEYSRRIDFDGMGLHPYFDFMPYSQPNMFVTIPLMGDMVLRESLSAVVVIRSEPRIPLLSAPAVVVTEATDEKGRSLVLAPGAYNTSNISYYYGAQSLRSSMMLRVNLLATGGRLLKVIKGYIPVTVRVASRPLVIIEDFTNAKKKTYRESGVVVTVESATSNGVEVSAELTISRARQKGAGKGDDVNDYSWPGSILQRIELRDNLGNVYGHSINNYVNYGPESVTVQVTFARRTGPLENIGLAAIFQRERPKSFTFVLNEWITANHTVPFEFTDLPLP